MLADGQNVTSVSGQPYSSFTTYGHQTIGHEQRRVIMRDKQGHHTLVKNEGSPYVQAEKTSSTGAFEQIRGS
jgi:hypothetical protein